MFKESSWNLGNKERKHNFSLSLSLSHSCLMSGKIEENISEENIKNKEENFSHADDFSSASLMMDPWKVKRGWEIFEKLVIQVIVVTWRNFHYLIHLEFVLNCIFSDTSRSWQLLELRMMEIHSPRRIWGKVIGYKEDLMLSPNKSLSTIKRYCFLDCRRRNLSR